MTGATPVAAAARQEDDGGAAAAKNLVRREIRMALLADDVDPNRVRRDSRPSAKHKTS